MSRLLGAPVDGAGLAVFRLLFGTVMLFAVFRFAARGWIDDLLLAPEFHFTYLGFSWVRPWPAWGMYLQFAVMAASAAGLAVGAWTRASALVFFVAFTHAELIDKTLYLNHYYFVSAVALLLSFLPSGACWSVDAWRRGRPAAVPAWTYLVLRSQVAVVYLFAGLAKLSPDWLFAAEPLRTWLRAHAGASVIGTMLDTNALAYALSWGGALFDLTIIFWLRWRRTRVAAFLVVAAFHVSVWCLFPIGVFSWIMIAAATIFFAPEWPRRLLDHPRLRRPGVGRTTATDRPPPGRLPLLLATLHLAVQILLPLRFILYPGPVNWTEEGFRFSWRVMLVEKAGSVELAVETEAPRRSFTIHPRLELTPLQYKMMSTQPDMIHEYAQHVAHQLRRNGHVGVQVRADAWASLNGRPSQRLIDPNVDLARESRSLSPKRWIVPMEASHAANASRQ